MDGCIFLFKTSQHCEGVEVDVPTLQCTSPGRSRGDVFVGNPCTIFETLSPVPIFVKNNNSYRTPRYLLALELVPTPIPYLANIGNAFTCHTERRKTKRKGRAMLADVGEAVQTNSNVSK
jgi:hypothetical protein